MKKINLFFVILFLSVNAFAQTIAVTNLKCESKESPIGIDIQNPRLSWQLVSKEQGVLQEAYRVIVADNAQLLQQNIGNVWDSKKVLSNKSIQVTYAGKKLESVKTYYWKVMVWNNKNEVSVWTAATYWQMGLLTVSAWKGAQWIGYDKLPDSLHITPFLSDVSDKRWQHIRDILPVLRREFSVNKEIKKATAYISGLGQFDMSLNGNKVGDHFLDPGWTKYDKQALYVTFDITSQIKQGSNAIGVMLGNGFYFIPGERYRKMSGAFGYPKMICRVVVQYKDGSIENIISDNSWKTSPGPVTFSSIYGGEDYDANLEQAGWNKAGFNDKNWKSAITVDGPTELNAQMEEPLKIFEHFKAVKISQPKPGIWVYDLGQNASGIPYLALKGKKGMVVKITPAELLGDDGLITQSAIGSPVYFNYTLKGEGTETWQPQFMYYGFRYIQIEGGVPKDQVNSTRIPVILNIEGLHTRNAAARIGEFTCSNDLFNRTFKLIDWAIQSNTASIFTDCPHREKLGWLEEAHLVGSSIRYNYDISNLSRKVIKDMMLSQTSDGLIPDIAPEYVEFGGGFRDSPEWGSNGIILPWYLYEWYDDKRILEESYDMMTRYVAYLEKKSDNHILSFGLGDWYDIGPNPPGVSQLTPRGVTATAMYYYDLTILSKTANLLGKSEDETKYKELSKQVKLAFNNKFFNKETKEYATGSQAANAMAVYMGLTETQYKSAVIENIVKDIRSHNNGITAGDIGYRYLLRVLDDAGRSDVIFDMNNRSDVPGYGFQLAQGATALTESWQGARNASNNHFMLGHLMEWFYSGLGGIRPGQESVAFHQIIIRPEPVGDVTFAKASYKSPYGLIVSEWKKEDQNFYLEVEIPANTKATIYLPSKENSIIEEHGKSIKNRNGLEVQGYKEGRVVVEIGSGKYSFKVANH